MGVRQRPKITDCEGTLGLTRTTKSVPPPSIRVTALCACFDPRGRLLVEQGYDRVRDEHFLRGIGGGVEPGERAVEALHREWREELGLTLTEPTQLGVLENFFTHEGREGHEIVFVFRARVVEPWVYLEDEFTITESDALTPGALGTTHRALWAEISALEQGGLRVLPLGFLNLAAAAV